MLAEDNSTNDDLFVDVSDDEKYNPTGEERGTWMPHPDDILEMFDLLSKQTILELNWKCPGRRLPSKKKEEKEEPMEVVEEAVAAVEPVVSQKAPDVVVVPNEFDFDDDVSIGSARQPMRTPGGRTPKPQKRVARMDKVLDDILRQRQENQSKSPIYGSPRSRGSNSPRGRIFTSHSRSPIGSPRVPARERSVDSDKIVTSDFSVDKIINNTITTTTNVTSSVCSLVTNQSITSSVPSSSVDSVTPIVANVMSDIVHTSNKILETVAKIEATKQQTVALEDAKPLIVPKVEPCPSEIPDDVASEILKTQVSSTSMEVTPSAIVSTDDRRSIVPTTNASVKSESVSPVKSTSSKIEEGISAMGNDPVAQTTPTKTSVLQDIIISAKTTASSIISEPTIVSSMNSFVSSSTNNKTSPILSHSIPKIMTPVEGSPTVPLNLSHTPSPVTSYSTTPTTTNSQTTTPSKSPTPRPAHVHQQPAIISSRSSPKPAHSIKHSPPTSQHPAFGASTNSRPHEMMNTDTFYASKTQSTPDVQKQIRKSPQPKPQAKSPVPSHHKHLTSSTISGSGPLTFPVTPVTFPANMHMPSSSILSQISLAPMLPGIPHYKSRDGRSKKTQLFYPQDFAAHFMSQSPFLPPPAHSIQPESMSAYHLPKPPTSPHSSLKLTVSKNLQQQMQRSAALGKPSKRHESSPSYRIASVPQRSPHKSSDISPHRLSVSVSGQKPTRVDQKLTSPGVKMTSPGLKMTSPGLKMTSPGLKSISPGQKLTSPGQKITSPGQKITSPGQKITSPGQKLTSPGPGQKSTSPNTARKVSSSPRGDSKSEQPSVETHRVIQTGPLSISIKATSIRDLNRDSANSQSNATPP